MTADGMTQTTTPGTTELPEGWERVAADGLPPFVEPR